MPLSKIRKFDSENRVFRDEWPEKYVFILPATIPTRPVCLICMESVAIVKKWKINGLKAHCERSTQVLSHSLTAQERAYEWSLRIQLILHNIKMVKECMNAMCETLPNGKEIHEL